MLLASARIDAGSQGLIPTSLTSDVPLAGPEQLTARFLVRRR